MDNKPITKLSTEINYNQRRQRVIVYRKRLWTPEPCFSKDNVLALSNWFLPISVHWPLSLQNCCFLFFNKLRRQLVEGSQLWNIGDWCCYTKRYTPLKQLTSFSCVNSCLHGKKLCGFSLRTIALRNLTFYDTLCHISRLMIVFQLLKSWKRCFG